MSSSPQVVTRNVTDLIPYARNARTHSDEQVSQIAASIREFGWTNPVLIDGQSGIIAGHGRVLAARKLGQDQVPCIELAGMSETQRRAYIIADNKLALNAGWDADLLSLEFEELTELGFDVELTGFTQDEIDALRPEVLEPGLTDEDAVPELQAEPVSKPGDVWILGKHRVMCGDSTSLSDVEKLMGGEIRAPLLHADPPYGMGKEGDGVANDNLYLDKLDAFQMDWWAVWRTFMADNASAYIWGNSPDLWRLWYRGGLGDSEQLELRNEIVWDKKSIAGMHSPLMTQYPEATERCLYFQVGEQFIGNVNADQYFEEWDEIRIYLESEAQAADLSPGKCRKITGVQMFAHWFSKSQWAFISEKHYTSLAKATGRFSRPYTDLRKIYEQIKGGYRSHINGILGGMRSYFDNAHDTMRDVWEFPRVIGDDRHGHATPKPVGMMERVMKSSCPPKGICLEPFCGSGSTLIGAEKTGRVCFTMEMQGQYVDVIIRRWQDFTGKQATHEATGATFNEVAATSTAAIETEPA